MFNNATRLRIVKYYKECIRLKEEVVDRTFQQELYCQARRYFNNNQWLLEQKIEHGNPPINAKVTEPSTEPMKPVVRMPSSFETMQEYDEWCEMADRDVAEKRAKKMREKIEYYKKRNMYHSFTNIDQLADLDRLAEIGEEPLPDIPEEDIQFEN